MWPFIAKWRGTLCDSFNSVSLQIYVLRGTMVIQLFLSENNTEKTLQNQISNLHNTLFAHLYLCVVIFHLFP